MSKSYLIRILAAIGIVLCATIAQSQEQPQALQNPPQASNEKPEEDIRPSFVVGLEGIEKAIRESIRDESEAERNRQTEIAEKDLAAQTEMAKWAFEMAVAAIAAAVFTLLGLILIARTLHHTKRAADYTRDMLKEAKKTTDASMAIVKADRAWMIHSEVLVLPSGNNNHNEVESFSFLMRFQNFGRSPAQDTTIGTKISENPDEIVAFIAGFLDEVIDPTDGSAIGTNQSMSGSPQNVPISQISRYFSHKEFSLYIGAVIKYRDIFGEVRHSSAIRIILPTANLERLTALPQNPFECWQFALVRGIGDKNT